MTLDIVLLIVTIVIAVAAVIVSLLQAVLERRRSGRRAAQRRPREVEAGRLGRAVPPPVMRADVAAPPTAAEWAAPIAARALLIPPEPEPAPTLTATPFTSPPVPVAADVEVVSAPAPAAAPLAVSAIQLPAPVSPPDKGILGAAAAASMSVAAASAPATWRDGQPGAQEPDIDPELAYRIGIPGAKRPSRPAVLVVADGEKRTVTLPGTVATESWPAPPRHRRRAAFRVAAAATALASVMTAVLVLPDLGQQGGILGETGRPASGAPGAATLETPTPTPPTVTPAPTPAPTPSATPTLAPTAAPPPSATPSAAASQAVQVASTTPKPHVTPPPAAPPTAKPPPQPAGDSPTNQTTAPVPPPVAAFDCKNVPLTTLACDGSKSDNAATYVWDFGEGHTQSGPHASHTFLLPKRYDVTLTVTNAAGSDTRTQTFRVP